MPEKTRRRSVPLSEVNVADCILVLPGLSSAVAAQTIPRPMHSRKSGLALKPFPHGMTGCYSEFGSSWCARPAPGDIRRMSPVAADVGEDGGPADVGLGDECDPAEIGRARPG